MIVTAGTLTAYDGDDPACTPHLYTAGMGLVDEGGDHTHVIRNEGSVEARTVAVQLIPAAATRRIDAEGNAACQFDHGSLQRSSCAEFDQRAKTVSVSIEVVSGLGLALALMAFLIAGCDERATPVSPSPNGSIAQLSHDVVEASVSHDAGAHEEKGYIDGWFDGTSVRLYYTKLYFCSVPPLSGAGTGCRSAPTLRSLLAQDRYERFMPSALSGSTGSDDTRLSAREYSLNHPAMIDASRVGGRGNGPGLPHSHIVDEHGGGWRHTVNIRVFNLDAWNQSRRPRACEGARTSRRSGSRPARGHQRGYPDEHLLLHCLVE